MWEQHRIACITYHKFPKDPWPEERFVETEVEMPAGEVINMKLARKDDARAVIRDLCRTAVDLVPDKDAGVLEIRVHGLANPRSDHAIEHLLVRLNETELNYPGTNLRLAFCMASHFAPLPDT